MSCYYWASAQQQLQSINLLLGKDQQINIQCTDMVT